MEYINKFQDEGIVIDKKRRVSVFALDFIWGFQLTFKLKKIIYPVLIAGLNVSLMVQNLSLLPEDLKLLADFTVLKCKAIAACSIVKNSIR
ncbi:hypothetical protein [Flavobacterium sp. CF136]|uniref:hypothetical protein n=1 Tax=Flavobacterium sp. (strain CF136) TaxID=1144313 RepID=UPI000553F0BC|nr:hypothetical protein [Flavobacterium sp. CF136]